MLNLFSGIFLMSCFQSQNVPATIYSSDHLPDDASPSMLLAELAKDGEAAGGRLRSTRVILRLAWLYSMQLVTAYSCLRAMVYLLHLWRACLRRENSW